MRLSALRVSIALLLVISAVFCNGQVSPTPTPQLFYQDTAVSQRVISQLAVDNAGNVISFTLQTAPGCSFGICGAVLYSISPNGSVNWVTSDTTFIAHTINEIAIAPNNSIFFQDFFSLGQIRGIWSSGIPLPSWPVSLGTALDTFSPSLLIDPVDQSVLAKGGSASAFEPALTRTASFQQDGTTKWISDLAGGADNTPGMIIGPNNNIYTFSDHTVLLDRNDGHTICEFPSAAGVKFMPITGGDGLVFSSTPTTQVLRSDSGCIASPIYSWETNRRGALLSYDQGIVIAGDSPVNNTQGSARLLAISRDGVLLWHNDLIAPQNVVSISQGLIYVAGLDANGGNDLKLFVVNENDGSIATSLDLTAVCPACVKVAVGASGVYVGDAASTKIYKINGVGGTSNTGTITVSTNIGAATFTIRDDKGHIFGGSGSSFQITNVLSGSYTISYGPVTGYLTPGDETQLLTNGGTLLFTGTYIPVPSAPAPAIQSISSDHTSRGQSKTVTIIGSNFDADLQVQISGTGISVQVHHDSSTQLTLDLTLSFDAQIGVRTLVFTNHDGQWASIPFAVTKRAVVIVPGTMGSTLEDSSGGIIWPDGIEQDVIFGSLNNNDLLCNTHVLPLALASDGVTPESTFLAPCGLVFSSGVTVHPTGLIRSQDDAFPALTPDYYGTLASALADQYDVVAFPYDWRIDLETNALDLKTKIDNIAVTEDGIDLIAHSQGGLVVRTYLGLLTTLDAQWQTRFQIGKVVFLGTPQRGAPKDFAILNGNDFQGLTDAALLLNFTTSNFLAAHFQALYEMLPRYPFYIPAGQSAAEPFLATWTRLAASNPDAPPFVVKADQRWHNDISSDISQFTSIAINGSGVNTLAGLQEITKRNIFGNSHICIEPILDATGDGTVPSQSSSAFSSIDYFIASEHSNLPKNPTAIDMIVGILATGRAPLSDPWSSEAFDASSTWTGNTCSPVRITARDEFGNVTENSTGFTRSMIPNSRLFEFAENEGFFLPGDRAISIALQATGDGTFDLNLNLHSHGTIQQYAFTDVPIAVGSRANIELERGSVAPIQMQLDLDGDGIPDFTFGANRPLPPDAYVSALLVIIRSIGLEHGNEKQFASSLFAASASLARGDMASARGQLEAFENKIRAKTGSIIPNRLTPTLIELAEDCKRLLI